MDDIDELKEEYQRVLLRVSIKALKVVEGTLKQKDFPGRADLALKFLGLLNPAEILAEVSAVEEEEDYLWEEEEAEDEDEDEDDEDEDE